MKQPNIQAARVPRNPLRLMFRVYRYVLPTVDRELCRWTSKAEQIPDPELKQQALASMKTKRFHCQGGAVYGIINLSEHHRLIPLIVAFQTISDYLDNLCDRSTSLDPDDFRMLHQSMLDAVDPDEPLHDYYVCRTEKEDGGYLRELVETCRKEIRGLSSYPLVKDRARELVSLYCDLQVYKHIQKDLREPALHQWWEGHLVSYPDISWNEFAAATGSTLGVFMLFQAASKPDLDKEQAQRIVEAYFPYVCGLHILLDYLIDQEEDVIGGDLNFCSYYADMDETVNRIAYFVTKSRERVAHLEHAHFHRMIIEGLLALYLSDPKVKDQKQVRSVSRKLMKKSPMTRMFFWMNSIWIRKTS